jgi:MFS family permease
MDREKLWTKDFVIVSLINFFIFLTYYLLVVILSVFAIERFNASQSQAGLASSIFIIGTVIARPFSGKFIEKIGRKRMLLFGMIIFLLTSFLYLEVNDLILLLINRFIHGIGFGIASTATGTIVAYIIPHTRRGEGIGYYAVSTNLAMAIGPFLGLFIIHHAGYTAAFIVCVVFSALAFASQFFLNVPKVNVPKTTAEVSKKFDLKNYFEFSALPISIVICILGVSYSSVITFINSYSKDINLVEAASFFFILYAGCLLLSRPYTGRLFDLKGENFVIFPALLLFSTGLVILSQSHHGVTFLVSGALIGLGFGNFQSSAQTIAVKKAPPNRIGLATSTFLVLFDAGLGIGPFLLGFLIPLTGFRRLYMIMAGLVLVCLVLYYFLHGKKTSVK